MKAKRRQSGVTLMEMTVVVAVAAMLAALGLPAIRTFFNSLATEGSTKAMIGAALSSARAIAAERQRYVGVRFQKAYHPAGSLKAPQYMIFIINDPAIGAYFFRAVEGTQPIKLPENLGVMDFTIVSDRNRQNPVNPGDEYRLDDISLSPNQNNYIDNDSELTDMTAFSIIFSPSGKLVAHGVRVRNRDDKTDASPATSYDDVFNTLTKITNPVYSAGMFLQDDYFGANLYPDIGLGLGPEPSRRSFVIYERDKFRQALDKYQPYSGYLYKLRRVYINPYTGTIIDSR